jgi:acyl-CoA synthetase (AMP-forming)/AMP-acid ligase II
MKSVKTLASSAAYLLPQLADQISAHFTDIPRFTEGYSMSEFTMTITMKPISGLLNGYTQNKPSSAGILILSVEARVVHPNGSLASPNEQSELLVRGGSAVLGHKRNDKATRETFVDGWVRTGDHMRINED